jgi:hypothetical protein
MSATAQRPLPLHELAPGLALARGGPGRTLNVYLLGDVVVDAGVRWSRRRLARQLAGRQLAAHMSDRGCRPHPSIWHGSAAAPGGRTVEDAARAALSAALARHSTVRRRTAAETAAPRGKPSSRLMALYGFLRAVVAA